MMEDWSEVRKKQRQDLDNLWCKCNLLIRRGTYKNRSYQTDLSHKEKEEEKETLHVAQGNNVVMEDDILVSCVDMGLDCNIWSNSCIEDIT